MIRHVISRMRNDDLALCLWAHDVWGGISRKPLEIETWVQSLLTTGLPSFNTVIHNCQHVFNKSWFSCRNSLVVHLQALAAMS